MTANDPLLSAYVDGELDADAAAEVERLVAADARARRTVEINREMTVLLRAACGEQIYAAASARLGGGAGRHRPLQRRQFVRAAAAVVAAAALGGGAVAFWPVSERANLVYEIAEYHAVYSHETTHLVEVPAARTDELVAWLGQRIDRKITVPDLQAAGLRFAGGRLLVISGQPVAQLAYTRPRGLPVAVCIARLAGTKQGLTLDHREGLRLASWTDGTFAYVVVGDLESAALHDIAGRVAAQLNT